MKAAIQHMVNALAEAAYLGLSDTRIDTLSQRLIHRASGMGSLLAAVYAAVEAGTASNG